MDSVLPGIVSSSISFSRQAAIDRIAARTNGRLTMSEHILNVRVRRSILLAGLSLSALMAIATPLSLHHGFGLSTSQAWADDGGKGGGGGEGAGGSGHDGSDDHDNGGTGSDNSGSGHDGEDNNGQGANDDGPGHDVGDDQGNDNNNGNDGADDGPDHDGTPDRG